jgi:hypothetical protein
VHQNGWQDKKIGSSSIFDIKKGDPDNLTYCPARDVEAEEKIQAH